MSNVADRLNRFLENVFRKASSQKAVKDNLVTGSGEQDSFIYETIEEYKEAGQHFRRTKNQMSRGLTREEAFEEFRKEKKSL